MPRINDGRSNPAPQRTRTAGTDTTAETTATDTAATTGTAATAEAKSVGDGERSALYVKKNGALLFPEGAQLSADDKVERARRLLEVMRTKQESKLTFGGRVSLSGVDPAASLRNYYGSMKVASSLASHAPDLDDDIAAFAKSIPMPGDLRHIAFAAAGVDGTVKPEPAKPLGAMQTGNIYNTLQYGLQGTANYLDVPDDMVKQLPQSNFPLDLNGLMARAQQPLRPDIAVSIARFVARAQELHVPGVGVSDWAAVGNALPKNAEGAAVLGRLAKAFGKSFADVELHGTRLSDARPPRLDVSPRRAVGALGDERFEGNDFQGAVAVGDPRFTRLSDDSLRKAWGAPGSSADLGNFTNIAAGTAFRVGLLYVFARAKELGLNVTANVNQVQSVLNNVPASQEAVDGARRLARAFGFTEGALQAKTDAAGQQTATLDRFPPTRGLPPRRLAAGQALGATRLSGEQAQELLNHKDHALFSIDDDTLAALAARCSDDYTVGYVVATQDTNDAAWARGAFKLWERALERDPNLGSNHTNNPGTGRLGDFIRQNLRDPVASDPAAMDALARVVVRAGIDPTPLTTAQGYNILQKATPPYGPSVFAHAYEQAKRALTADTAAVPVRRMLRKLWQEGPLGAEQFRDKGARDWGYGTKEARYFQMDDDSLRAFGAFDINAWSYHFNSPKVFSFVARAAELQGAPAQWNQFTQYIQSYLSSRQIPAQFSGDDAIPHIARMATAANVPFENVRLTSPNGALLKLSDHPILRGTDPASVSVRTAAIQKDLPALDPANRNDGARVDALTSLLGGQSLHEFSELLPTFLKGRLDGTIASTMIDAKTADDIGALAAAFGHIGASAVLLGLATQMPREKLASALLPLAASKAHASEWALVAEELQRLSGAELSFVLADVARDPARPDFTTLAQRLELVGAHVDAAAIEKRFDQSGRYDPVSFARVMVERAFLAPPDSEECADVLEALGALVEKGKLSARQDVSPAMSSGARGEVQAQIFDDLDRAVGAYQKGDVATRETELPKLLGAFDKATAFLEPGKVVEHLLGALLQSDLARAMPLDAADAQLGGVEGAKGEKTSPFPPGTKTVTLGGVELAQNVDPTKDARAVPRAANAELVMTATTERNLRLIAGSWRKRRPVLLEGPTSAGKTAIVRYIAHKTGSPYRRINMSYYTDVSDLVGRYVGGEKRFEAKDLDAKQEAELRAIGEEYGFEDAKMPLADLKTGILEAQKKPRWVDGPIVKAMKRGEVLLLDEMNLARNEVIERLNSLFDDDGNLVLTEHNNEVIKQHENFRIFGTVNPASYAGRTRLSEAMRSRWNNVYAHGLTQADVKTILKAKYADKIPDVELAKLIAVHDNLARLADEGSIGRKTGGIAYSLRNVFRVAERFVRYQGGELSDDALMRRETEEIYRGGLFEEDDLRTVDDILATAMPYDGPGFYDHLELKEDDDSFTIGDVVVQKLNTGHQMVPPAKSRLIMTQRTKQAMYRLAKALDMGENVALVGERAAGKTALTKMYAHLRGQPYYRQLFTAGTDGMQLVGGYDHLGWKDGLLLTAGRPENVPGIYLADEFNVGSAAAQERFNSVLDDERKVVLAEKEGEEIRLNKDYRFVAAMNPPTQAYGGREKLSKAMQNRLTVIWVPDLKEKNELLEVALGRAKQMGVQEAIAEALVELHAFVVEAYKDGTLGKDVRERDRPVYSVRQLMAALEMVQEFQGEKGPADAFLYAVETCYASVGENTEDQALILEKAQEIAE